MKDKNQKKDRWKLMNKNRNYTNKLYRKLVKYLKLQLLINNLTKIIVK